MFRLQPPIKTHLTSRPWVFSNSTMYMANKTNVLVFKIMFPWHYRRLMYFLALCASKKVFY